MVMANVSNLTLGRLPSLLVVFNSVVVILANVIVELLCLVFQSIKNHSSAWPFLDAVDENFAPHYYDIVRVNRFLSSSSFMLFF